ncbi:hypothetical protein BT96DRAFT_1091269 [Gymnopus androsaceus JB14]|uniref:Uncharacterized protein n=1 Tax=Gymnopus androsaceus JB14 TaxID=1447944 RepID=A0A6A4GID4_9AGAR|nr:hypothetical protein BT96DRAFT_1091269 [Gymnopus androsaceus JB14]
MGFGVSGIQGMLEMLPKIQQEPNGHSAVMPESGLGFALTPFLNFSGAASECVYKGETIKSTLDLTRYLQSYDGTLRLKVAKPSPELSSLFSESRWMKFKIVTEPDASVVIQNAAFKDAFSSIAQTTVDYLIWNNIIWNIRHMESRLAFPQAGRREYSMQPSS